MCVCDEEMNARCVRAPVLAGRIWINKGNFSTQLERSRDHLDFDSFSSMSLRVDQLQI